MDVGVVSCSIYGYTTYNVPRTKDSKMDRPGGKGSSLFKQGKDSEEVLVAKEKQRLGLLKSLSRSIKEVQLMFANQSTEHPDQAYIRDCRPAHRLCAQFEDILRHGLKPGWFGGETTFWPVVLKVSRKQAIQYIKGLQYAQTDNGRCRAWIRLAVNECSLESYINVICQDSKLLSSYYETHSFVRSHEMVSALTQLLVGLTELTFKLTVDTASLEFEAAPEAVNSVPLKLRLVDEPKQRSKGKKKKVSTESKENGSVPENISGSDDSLDADNHSLMCVDVSEIPEPITTSESLEPHSQIPEPSDTSHTDVTEVIPVSLANVGLSEDGVTSGSPPTLSTEPTFYGQTSHHPGAVSPQLNEQSNKQEAVNTAASADKDITTETLKHLRMRSWGLEDTLPVPLVHIEDIPPVYMKCCSIGSRSRYRDMDSVMSSKNNDDEVYTPEYLEPKFYSQTSHPETVSPQLNKQQEVATTKDEASEGPSFQSEGSPTTYISQSMEDTLDTFQDLSLADFVPQAPIPKTSPPPSSSEQPETTEKISISTQAEDSDSDSYVSVPEPLSSELVMEEILITQKTDSDSDKIAIATDAVCEKLKIGDPVKNDEKITQEFKQEAKLNTAQSTEHEITENQTLESATDVSRTVKKNTNPFSQDGLSDVEEGKRESVVSRGTLIDDDDEGSLESSLDWGIRSSGETTPTRKRTNPFFDSDEEEMNLRTRFVTNPFAEDNAYIPSQVPQIQNRPVSFSIPPPPSRLPSNPFADDDDITPMNESSHGNKLHLQLQSSVDSVDTPTIDQYLPPLNRPIQYLRDSTSNETTPSISPVSFSKEQSPDTVSTASSQDLLLALDEVWEPGTSSHLSPMEDHFGAELSQSELHAKISCLKAQLKDGGGDGDKAEFRRRVVALQLRLQQMREDEEEGVGDSTSQEVFGHRLMRQPRQTKMSGTPPTCEGCRKQVRGIIRLWYLCKTCGCACHKKCISKIARRCNQLNRITEDATYTLAVCPERGLTRQKFRCGSCTQSFNSPSSGGARLCDYSGLYHCKQCHHNDEALIPARVLHNWDFKPRKVCCHCFDLLTQLSTKVTVQVNQVNAHLYTHVADLSNVEDLRKDLLVMKNYFMQCRLAREAQLLQQLNQLLHFKDNALCYSIVDLAAVQDGSLLPRLQDAHREYYNHIKEECPLCSGKGYLCEMCKSEEVLFPFDKHTSQCTSCKYVFHRSCFTETSSCLRCTRLKERPR